jgi:hypothetical protein
MTIKTRRTLRLVAMGIMLCSAVSAGFMWAQPPDARNAVIAVMVTALSFSMVLLAEFLATRAETELELLTSVILTDREQRSTSDDTIIGLNRLVDMLSSQNRSFKGNILHQKILEQNDIRREEATGGKDVPMG